MKFSQRLDEYIELAESIGRRPPIGPDETERLLEKATRPNGLSDDEIIELLNGLDNPKSAQAVLDFSRDYVRPRDHEVFLLPPLYFSSICENKCAYCDFATGGGIRLTPEEFGREVDALLKMGYRSIELVSSQDPELYRRQEPFSLEDQHFDLTGAIRYFEILKEKIESGGGGMITSNIPPVCARGFGELRSAGLDCFLAWLETFDPGQYERLHCEVGPKGDQAFRLDSFERSLEAGVEHVAGGFLKGLADWRREEAILYLFDRHLVTEWGKGFSIIGSPRVKGRFLRSKVIKECLVSDEDYRLNIALDRVLFDGILWLQTRESFEFNRELINDFGGGVVLTVTSCTAPGGYSKPAETHSQFPVHSQDHRDSAERLEEDGFVIHRAWDASDLSSCRRSPR
ncbi:MAG: radical SAM protein [Thermoanaerobaculales bacterium]|jgi:2-iminoacetate synthase|nr:radical SAM protein [Thermoanaerobaculales bacterium]